MLGADACVSPITVVVVVVVVVVVAVAVVSKTPFKCHVCCCESMFIQTPHVL